MVQEDFEWPEPEAPRPPYVTRAVEKGQARGLYLNELAEMHKAIKGLRKRLPEVVKSAKANGATWEEIGDALETSRQAACRSFIEAVEA